MCFWWFSKNAFVAFALITRPFLFLKSILPNFDILKGVAKFLDSKLLNTVEMFHAWKDEYLSGSRTYPAKKIVFKLTSSCKFYFLGCINLFCEINLNNFLNHINAFLPFNMIKFVPLLPLQFMNIFKRIYSYYVLTVYFIRFCSGLEHFYMVLVKITEFI